MMVSFRTMVRGQTEKYEITNAGLARQETETNALLTVVGFQDKAAQQRNKPKGVGPAAGAPPAVGENSRIAQRRSSEEEDKITQNHSKLFKKMIDTTALDKNFEAKATRVLLTMALYNVFNTFMWQTNALCIMLVGVGVKLAIYNPTASPTAHFAAAQRLEMGLPLSLVFFIQLFRTIFISNWHHYSWSALKEQPTHTFVVLGRIALMVAMILVVLQPIGPLPVMVELALLAIGQCALMQLQDFKFPIKSLHEHPMRALPNALLALQQKRKRAEDRAKLPPRPLQKV
jgi:hypothetical protein